MKLLFLFFLLLALFNANSQNVGIGTTAPAHKLDINGNIGMFGRQAISGLGDGWLRFNQMAAYSNGLYSPGVLRIDGGILSGAASSLGPGTILATAQIQAPIFYDLNNTNYFVSPASTSNLSTLRFTKVDCMSGYCPPNNVIRLTPNLHFNAGTGYPVIINWDNNTVPSSNSQQFRIGNGQGADVFYVTSLGNVIATGNKNGGSLTTTGALTSGPVIIDNGNLNTGTIANGLTFGSGSGQGIGSRRNAGSNQYGLDFYTGYSQKLTITQPGLVGIGNTSPLYKLHVVENNLGATTTYSENQSSGNNDGKAVYGKSINNPGYGYGGFFEGGFEGMHAQATTSNYTGSAWGVYSSVDGSAGFRYAVEGTATTSVGTSAAYGVYGTASGASTNYGIYCNGNGGYTGTWSSVSDQKLKTNITDYSGALEKVIKLLPKRYYFKTQEYGFMFLPEGEQIGLIAQDVQKVFPQLIENNSHGGESIQMRTQ